MPNIQKLIFNDNVLDVSNISSDSPIKQLVLNTFFPVGSIYMDATGKINPNTQFGGTWVKIENRFLYGQGTKAIGATGGAETVALSLAQMPPHSHNKGGMEITGETLLKKSYSASGSFYVDNNSTSVEGSTAHSNGSHLAFRASSNWIGNTGSQGSGAAHENMPPYLVVAIWQRTA